MWSLVSRPGAIFTTGHLVILIWPPELEITQQRKKEEKKTKKQKNKD